MEINFKQLKKIIKNEELINVAKELDKNQNKQLDGNEISIFEQYVYNGVKNNSINTEVYTSIFGHDISERIPENRVETKSNSPSANNVIISSHEAQIMTDAKFKPDGTLNNKNQNINGQIILRDTAGNKHSIKLTIEPNQILGLNGENPKEYFQKIIDKLIKSINELPDEIKSDFYNEINQINIGGEKGIIDTGFQRGYTKPNGSFNGDNNTIVLNILGRDESGLTSTTLMHEIGHSIDHIKGEFQSDAALKQKAENLKNILKEKGFDTDSYSNERNIQGYWLKDNLEILAEYYVYSQLSKSSNLEDKYITNNSRYNMLHKAATSEDPEIQKAFKEFEAEYVKILNNSRSSTPDTRKGNDLDSMMSKIGSVQIKLSKDDNYDAYVGFVSLPDLVKTNSIDLCTVSPADVLKEYYMYLNKSNTNQEWNNIFKELDINNSKEWSDLKGYYKNILNELK